MKIRAARLNNFLTQITETGENLTYGEDTVDELCRYLSNNYQHGIVLDLGVRHVAIWGGDRATDPYYAQALPLLEPDVDEYESAQDAIKASVLAAVADAP